jgi:4-diphosphocytidyl-2-C-methyl-D-erythritol kinase
MERVIRRDAHAKLNVFLRVLGRRPDGYHDIESLIVPVSLADEVTVRVAPDLRLSVRGPLAEEVPLDESNLVVRAAELLAARCSIDPGADIELVKRIPVSAGLGGGSADAAAVLVALNELWSCDLSGDDLLELAAEVGSDVPALLRGGPVLVRGRGDVVEPATQDSAWWVLVPQPFGISAADAYAWWDEDGGVGSGSAKGNDLEPSVARRHPEILEAKERLLAEGARDAIMAGSGPTVAGLAESEDEARRIGEAIPGSIVVSTP